MRAASSVARSEVAGLAKAARAVKVRVGTVVGASVRVLSGSCSNVTLGGAAGRGWAEAGTLCVIGVEGAWGHLPRVLTAKTCMGVRRKHCRVGWW